MRGQQEELPPWPNQTKKIEISPISNRIATLTLQVGAVKIGLLGCHAPNETSEETKRKESLCRKLVLLLFKLKQLKEADC